jgi:hypothetical protein
MTLSMVGIVCFAFVDDTDLVTSAKFRHLTGEESSKEFQTVALVPLTSDSRNVSLASDSRVLSVKLKLHHILRSSIPHNTHALMK